MDFNKQLMDERGYGTVFEPKCFSGQYKEHFSLLNINLGCSSFKSVALGLVDFLCIGMKSLLLTRDTFI